MVDVCFGSSAKGALKRARHVGKGKDGPSAIAFIGEEPISRREKKEAIRRIRAEQEARQRYAVPLEGSTGDVVSVSFGLSMGEIASPLTMDGGPRERLIRRWITAAPWGESEAEELEESARAFWESCKADWNALAARARGGEPVRIWVDPSPDALCGLLAVAQLLVSLEVPLAPVTAVSLPGFFCREDGKLIAHTQWGDVPPEEFGRFLPRAEVLPPLLLSRLAGRWRSLQEENAPLRAVVGGRIVSVGETFYDGMIRRSFPGKRFRVGELIGQVLTRYPVGIGDWLVAQRIRVLLDRGELRWAEGEPQAFYGGTVEVPGGQ